MSLKASEAASLTPSPFGENDAGLTHREPQRPVDDDAASHAVAVAGQVAHLDEDDGLPSGASTSLPLWFTRPSHDTVLRAAPTVRHGSTVRTVWSLSSSTVTRAVPLSPGWKLTPASSS